MSFGGDRAESWPVRERVDLHRDAWVVALRADTVATPDGAEVRRVVLEHPGAAVVLAIDDADRVAVIRQYRHAAGHRMVELPAGLLDVAGEEPQAVAERELREEAELAADRWEPLVTTWASPGITQERHHVFLATGLRRAPRGDFELHAEEADMTLEWVSFDELVDAVLTGEVQDGPVVIALLALDARRRRPGRDQPGE